MKLTFASALLVVGTLAAAPGFVNAADAAKPGMTERAGHFQHGARDPVARTTRRLDDLGEKLNLKSPQQVAWQTYSAAIIAQARVRKHQWEQMRVAHHAPRENLTTPERMAKIADRLRQASGRMSQLASETKTFYDQLGPEQKTIFDLYAKAGWHGRGPVGGNHR